MTFSFEDASAATRAQVSKSRAHLAGLHVWIYRDARALAASAPHKATSSSEASEAAVSVPVIVCFHGRLETCQDVKMDALLTRVAAATGAVCVTFDNPNHGSRLVDVARNHAWDRGNLHHCVDMYSQMLGAVQDMNLVLELLPGTLGIPAGWSKVGVVGISQGGHTALLAASVLPRVDVVVGLIASGDYRTNMELRHQRMSRRYQQQQQQEQQQQLQDKSDGSATSASSEVRTKPTIPNPLPLAEYYPPTLEQCVGKYDPINNTSRIAEAGPLMLLINGKVRAPLDLI
jgi:pimeloyl-ACP methyl ester carboxylesterase